MDLTTRARVKAFIEINETLPSTTTMNNWLDARISEWSARAESMMDRRVATATYTEYLDVRDGQQVFSLRAYPVVTMSTVVNDSGREYTSGTIDSGDYSCMSAAGLLRIDDFALDSGPAALRVIYKGGMATTAASFAVSYPEIAAALDAQVAYVFERRANLGRTSVSAGPGSVSYVGALDWLPHVKQTLLRYRRHYIG